MRIYVLHNSDNALNYLRAEHLSLYRRRAHSVEIINIAKGLTRLESNSDDLVIIYGLSVFLKVFFKSPYQAVNSNLVLFVTGLGFYSYHRLFKIFPLLRGFIRVFIRLAE
jgi:hypothetical protein